MTDRVFGSVFVTITAALIVASIASSCAPASNSQQPLVADATLSQIVQGQQLFNHETFAGNGRVCASCHTSLERTITIGHALGLSPSEQIAFSDRYATFDLDPAFAEIVFNLNPSDGLFRSIDSDDGVGSSFTRLRDDGLIRVHLHVPSNIHVEPTDAASAADLETLADGSQTITLLRSPPNTTNLAEDNACRMWDCRVQGRFGKEVLSRQAIGTDGLHGAVGDHFEPGRAATSTEGLALGAFQAQLFTRLDLFQAADGGTEPTLPACNASHPEQCRGREFFVSQPITVADAGHRGLCATCHSGPGLNTTNEFNPVQPPLSPEADGRCPCQIGGLPFAPPITVPELADGTCPDNSMPTVLRTIPTPVGPLALCFHRLSNNVVAEANSPQLPEFVFSTIDPIYGPIALQSPDVGHTLISGRMCEVPAACFLNPGSSQSVFRIQSLWGSSRRHRFFHDNSARSLEDVLAHNQLFFHQTALGLASVGFPDAAAFEISNQDAADMIAYIRGVGL